MTQAPLPDFKCPFCKSAIQRANVEKHLLNQHRDSHTIHKYQACQICGELVLKNKLTPHIRKMHGLQPGKGKR
jgi:ribosomal protein L32